MINRRLAFRFHWLLTALACLCLLPAFAQQQPQQQQLQRSVSLRGRVQSAGQTNISVSRLAIKLYFPKEANRAALLTYSDANGSFRFDGLPPGKFLLEVSSGNTLLHQMEVTVAAGKPPLDIRIGQTDAGQIVVQYFPKVFDQEQIEGALKKLGGKYKLSRGKTELGDTPTNAIFFGSDVSADDVKTVARALVDAGIKIRTIKRFKNSTPAKARTVQIGSDRGAMSAQVWDHNRINNASTFDR